MERSDISQAAGRVLHFLHNEEKQTGWFVNERHGEVDQGDRRNGEEG